MANFNKVYLMGNLTRDPELRYLPSGMALARIGMAVNRKYRNRNTQEMVEETTFVDIEGWGNQAETFCRYMAKGRPAFIEGRLKLDSWETKDGQKRTKLVVVMENFQFLGDGRGAGAGARDGGRPMQQHGGGGGGNYGSGGGGGGGGHQPNQGQPRGNQGGPPAHANQVSEGGGDRQPEDYDFDDIPF